MTALLTDQELFAIRQKYAGGGFNPHVCLGCLTPIQQRERHRHGMCMTCAKKNPLLTGLAQFAYYAQDVRKSLVERHFRRSTRQRRIT